MNNRTVYKLVDICDIKSGKRIPKGLDYVEYETEYPYIRARDIKDGRIKTDSLIFLEEYVQRKIKKYIINSGDIAITIVGASVGDVGYADDAVDGFNLTENAVRLTNFHEEVNSRYLFYLLYQKQYHDYMQLVAGAAAQPKLGIYKVERIKVSIPKREEQDKVVEILSRYDGLIETNKKRISCIEKMADNIYKEWFVRFRVTGQMEGEDNLPEGWNLQSLGEFGIELESGSRPKGGIDASLEGGIPSLGAESINNLAEFDYSSVKYIPSEYYEKMNRGKNKGNHILVYKDGAYIGKVTCFRDCFPYGQYAINEHVFFLNSKKPLYQNYLFFTLKQPAYYLMMQNLNRNAAQPGLSRPDMERLKINVPTTDIVEKFNDLVEPMLKTVFDLAKQNRILEQQRDLLLPRLMSGKLVV